MTVRRGVRTIAIAAVTAVLAISLGGCSFINSVGRAATDLGGAPQVGDCWTSTYNEVTQYANWGDAAPVSCGVAHELYTFAVPRLLKTHVGAEFSSGGKLEGSIADDAYNTCTKSQSVDFPVIPEIAARLFFDDLVPDQQSWDAGARWVRCDVGELATGSLVTSPGLAPIPSFSKVTAEISKTSDFNFCVNDPAGTAGSPVGADATYADCNEQPDWTLQLYLIIESGSPGYPGATYLQTQYQQQCQALYADARHITFDTYPSQAEWNQGNDIAPCWVAVKP